MHVIAPEMYTEYDADEAIIVALMNEPEGNENT